jgi:hypothetical protein
VIRLAICLTLAVLLALPASGTAKDASTIGKQGKSTYKCNKNFKAAIVRKRSKTWDWQSKLYLDHTPTRYRERVVRGCGYLRWLSKKWEHRAHEYYMLWVEIRESTQNAICHVFGRYCEQALSVSSCETGGTFSVGAENGQFLGIFQMGEWERRLFGHGPTALEQSYAAWLYFTHSGKDWSPWSCKPT